MPSFSVLPGSEGFLSFGPALVSQSLTRAANPAAHLKDQLMLRVRWSALALAGISILCVSRPLRLAAEEIFFTEDFATAPGQRGWQAFGATNLFAWHGTNQNLQVTWDSSQPNGLFYHPLGMVLSKTNDFILEFDLRLADVAIGTTTNKPYTFQLVVGLTDLASATNAAFLRGTGFDSPNLVEFDYFPDSGYGATVSTPIISSNNEWNAGGFTYPLALTTGDVFHVQMRFVAARQTLMTRMTRNGAPFGPLKDATLGASFSDFRVDQMAISSYSDAGQDPAFAGSILAHGTVDNFVFVCPPPVGDLTGGFTGNAWQVQFISHTNWLYKLERTADFQTWTEVSNSLAGTGANLTLSDPNMPGGKAFYRVRATRP
jgi:hypothetical protein